MAVVDHVCLSRPTSPGSQWADKHRQHRRILLFIFRMFTGGTTWYDLSSYIAPLSRTWLFHAAPRLHLRCRYSDAFMLFTRVMEQLGMPVLLHGSCMAAAWQHHVGTLCSERQGSMPALSLMTFFIMLGCGLLGPLGVGRQAEW